MGGNFSHFDSPPPGSTVVDLETGGGCPNESCNGRQFDAHMPKPSCAAAWPDSRWREFASEMSRLVGTYKNDGKAHYALLLIPVGIILMLVSISSGAVGGLGGIIHVPITFLAILLFFTMMSSMKQHNERVDAQIQQLCASQSDGVVSVRLVTAWTQVCKPKHARTYRGLYISPAGADVRGMSMGMVPAPQMAMMPPQAVQGMVVAQAAAVQPMPTQMMQVVCPPGSKAGDTIQIQTGSGPMQLVVPAGVFEGMSFQVSVPAAQAPIVTAMAVPA